ncbi:MAG: GDYXXLXY domain-containing protein [Alphaproteobacteria bacterium]|nr:GDYXXLXY domain-containing protein [Alphaproteobacteria bacterium]
MRRNLIVFLLGLGVFAGLNYAIYEKEAVLAHGETMLVELAPVDPRSLMQGDYMRLGFALTRDLKAPKEHANSHVVLQKDAEGIARFIRFDDGTPLTAGQMKLPYHARHGSITLRPDSFLFQEGLRERYQAAKYGIFAYDAKGKAVLAGLADGEKKPITAEP